ncbi:MAG: flagellar hook-basal body complex protein FliE [Deltaproteobacteria bacterium]|nr:flagellar hook-basal body complex protein FliE [Deltaproteobacteria bacterium]MCX7953142.1 flagellar hook-basal body complex protein FliE [Deltaproteobacteria bacterium]
MKINNSSLEFFKQTPKVETHQTENRGVSFISALEEAIKKTDELQKTASSMMDKHLSGQGVELHDAIIAIQKADLSLQILNQIKNKIIKIYDELTRIQI